MIHAVAPQRVKIAEAGHVEGARRVAGAGGDAELAVARVERDLPDPPGAGMIAELDGFGLEFLCLAGDRIDHAAAVPGQAFAVIIAVEEAGLPVEIERGPEPPKLREGAGWRWLRLRCADRPYAPAAIAGALASRDIDVLPVDCDRAGPVAILRQSGIVHHQSGAVAASEAGFLDRMMPSGKLDGGGDRTVVAGDGKTKLFKRFDDGDGDRSDGQVEPLAAHSFGSAQIVLLAADRDAEGGVHDIELGVDAEGGGEEDFAVGAVAVEEIAVIEIAVAAGQSHRFRRLVQRIFVAFCQHVASSFFLVSWQAGGGLGSQKLEELEACSGDCRYPEPALRFLAVSSRTLF